MRRPAAPPVVLAYDLETRRPCAIPASVQLQMAHSLGGDAACDDPAAAALCFAPQRCTGATPPPLEGAVYMRMRIVYLAQGAYAGSADCWHLRSSPWGHCAYLSSVCVVPTMRRAGVGRALVQTALAQSRGLPVALYVQCPRASPSTPMEKVVALRYPATRAFYASLGFEQAQEARADPEFTLLVRPAAGGTPGVGSTAESPLASADLPDREGGPAEQCIRAAMAFHRAIGRVDVGTPTAPLYVNLPRGIDGALQPCRAPREAVTWRGLRCGAELRVGAFELRTQCRSAPSAREPANRLEAFTRRAGELKVFL